MTAYMDHKNLANEVIDGVRAVQIADGVHRVLDRIASAEQHAGRDAGSVRLLAATNRNLPEMVAQSLFREDLFYRINTIQIEIPPLRNRREDIALFVDYFLKKYTDLYGRPGLILHPQALEKLANYDWPGNIRELQHTIEKAVILAEKNVIRASDLFIRPGKALSFSEVPNLEEVERQAILAAITQNEGNLTAAAEQLGVSRQTLYNKMKRFNL